MHLRILGLTLGGGKEGQTRAHDTKPLEVEQWPRGLAAAFAPDTEQGKQIAALKKRHDNAKRYLRAGTGSASAANAILAEVKALMYTNGIDMSSGKMAQAQRPAAGPQEAPPMEIEVPASQAAEPQEAQPMEIEVPASQAHAMAKRSSVQDIQMLARGMSVTECRSLAFHFAALGAPSVCVSGEHALLAAKRAAAVAFAGCAKDWPKLMAPRQRGLLVRVGLGLGRIASIEQFLADLLGRGRKLFVLTTAAKDVADMHDHVKNLRSHFRYWGQSARWLRLAEC